MATTKQILGKVVITNKGEWNPSNVYETLDVVTYQGSSYMSKVYDNNCLPTDDNKWQLLAKKGDTYEVSETDIENIAKQITENANSDFNKNVVEKTETFNSNAKTKTTKFNENANTTVDSYNTNAEQKLKEYNENDTTKLKKYNDNATSSVDNYNTNASTKLNEYNTNSVDKLKEYNDNATKVFNNYNSNATTKLDGYNTNSDTKLKEYNDNASQKINEYNEHSKELGDKIDSTRKELDRVKNEILDQGLSNGSFIHLEDSAMAELQELSIDGVLKQETTKGLNFWFNATKSQGTSNGITFTLNENGTYIVNGKNDNSGNSFVFLNSNSNKLFLKAGTYYTIKPSIYGIGVTGVYTLDDQNKYIRLSDMDKGTFTLEQDTELQIYIEVPKGTVTVFNNFIFYPMIAIREVTEEDYEPYTGCQPSPSPDYEQPISVITGSQKLISCNKNLFNKDDFKILEGYYIGTAGNVGQATSNSIIYMPIKSNTSYSIQKISSNRFRVGTYNTLDILGKTLNNVIKNLDDTVTSYVLNNNNDKYLFFQYLGGDTNEQEILDSIQIEEGSIPTQFVEHQESSLTFDIPDGEFVGRIDDTYKDELAVVYNETDGQFHKILKKKVGRTIITNDNIDTLNAWLDNSKSVPALVIAKKQLGLEANWKLKMALTNRYTEISSYNDVRSDTFALNFQIANVWFLDERFTDLDTAKQLIIGTEIYVVLAESYEVDLGVCDMPITFDKISNLFVDNELSPETNIKYYRNFKETIQNIQNGKQDNLTAGDDIVLENNTISLSKDVNHSIAANKNEIERVKNAVLNTGDSTDTFVHLEDSAMAELQDLSVDGVLKQETTKGKQLYDYKDIYRKHDEFLSDENDWITVSGTNVDGNSVKYLNYYTNKSALLKPNTTYKLVLEIKEFYNKLSSSTKQTLIALCGTDNSSQYASNKQIMFCDLQKKIYVYDITTRDDFDNTTLMNRDFIAIAPGDEISITYRLSILESSDVTADTFVYEKFTGGQPSPSLDYEQPISVLDGSPKLISCNNNLFNSYSLKNAEPRFITNIESDGTIIVENVTISNGFCDTNRTLKQLCPSLKVGETVYFYCETDFRENNSLKKTIYLNKSKYAMYFVDGSDCSRVITQDDLDSDVIVYGGYNAISHIKIGISYKPINFYEAHQESLLTINIPEKEFLGYISEKYKDKLVNTYKEEDNQFHKILKKNIGKMTLNGSENIFSQGQNSKGLYCYIIKLDKKPRSLTLGGKSNYFPYSWNWHSNTPCFYCVEEASTITIVTAFSTLEEFKSWLSAHKVEFYYILAEPYEIDLGICDMPFSYDKVTNIFTDNELNPIINTKYYRNFTKTIQNLQVNEKELKQELIEINSRLSALETANSNVVSNSMQIEEGKVSE